MRKQLIHVIFAFGVLFFGISCKKEPAATYSTINVNISLLEYNFGIYAPGSWSTSTRARVRTSGTIVDSISSLLPAFNAPQGTTVVSPCTANLKHVSHAFRIQTNSVNTLELYDLSGVRATYDIYPAAVYYASSGDSTTLNCSNSGCVFSIFAAR
ncbi:MAG TPA: hypothetical protein VGO45_09565 [Bacteroidia bacterium]|jgi:hypothetical protein|nr:hypothetical protein [Bacteroidia bacterium]